MYCSKIKDAYWDLRYGEAIVYDLEMKNIYEKLKNSPTDDVTVNDLTFYPKTFFFGEVELYKRSLGAFFHKSLSIENRNNSKEKTKYAYQQTTIFVEDKLKNLKKNLFNKV